MSGLTGEKCVPCHGGVPPAAEGEIAQLKLDARLDRQGGAFPGEAGNGRRGGGLGAGASWYGGAPCGNPHRDSRGGARGRR
jgi:hypothetical protein